METLAKMTEALVVTLREGVEAALIVGIVLAYLRKTGRAHLSRSVYAGLALAVAASALGALLFHIFGLSAENEIFEGVVLITAAIMVGSLVIWMWRTARRIKREMEEKLERIVTRQPRRVLGATSSVGLLLFTFVMVFREGVETVLFLGALSISSANPYYNLLGAGAGLVLVVIFGTMLIRGSIHIDLKRFFVVTGVILLILVAKLFLSALHEFGEVGIIPAPNWMMVATQFIHHNETASALTLVALILLPSIMIFQDTWRSAVIPSDVGARVRRGKGWAVAVIVTALVLSSFLIWSLLASAGSEGM